MLVGEVPVAPEVAPLAITFGLLATFVVLYGLIQGGTAVLTFLHWLLSKTIGRVPLIGGSIVSTVTSWMQPFSNFLSAQLAGVDARIATYWHTLAWEVERIGREIAAGERALLTVTRYLTSGKPLSWFAHLLSKAVADVKALGHRTVVIERKTVTVEKKVQHATTGTIGAAIHTATRPIAGELQGLERWTYPRVKALEHEVAGTLEPDIAKLRARTKRVEDAAVRAYEWARGHWHVVTVGAITAAVAVALERLDLGWVKCKAVGKVGRRLCGLGPQLIDDLLSASIDVLLVSNLCDIVAATTEVAKQFEPVLLDVVAVSDALIGCHGATIPDPLPVHGVPLAATTTTVTL